MDLRGIAKLSNNQWIICGGMDSNQVVRARTFLLESASVGVVSPELQTLEVKDLGDVFLIQGTYKKEAFVLSISGEVVRRFSANDEFSLHKADFAPGLYLFVQEDKSLRLRF